MEEACHMISDGQDNIYSPTTTSIHVHDTGGNLFQRFYHRLFPYGHKTELKATLRLAWPTVLVQFSEQLLFVISLIFCGHLGKNQLDGMAMALTVINVAGCSVLQGLATGCETLFSQTYGSKNKKKVGIILQQSIMILSMVCLPCWAVLINVNHILLLFGQPMEIAENALKYCLAFVPGLPGYAMCMILTRYLRCQSVVIPSLIIGGVSILLTVVYHAIFIYWWRLDISGGGLALSLGFWSNAVLHIVFIIATKIYKTTWPGISWLCLEGWKLYMSLALPGMFMICLEWWSFEVLVFLIGLLGTTSLAAHAIMYQLAAILFMIPLGLTQTACVRVGNLLGEGHHHLARNSANVILSLTVLVGLFDSLLLMSFKDLIPLVFTEDSEVIVLSSKLIVILAVFHFVDSIESVTSGVIRGTGQLKFGATINLAAHYLIGLPISVVLIFLTSLQVAGAWWGVCIASTFQCLAYFIKLYVLNWVEEAKKASQRAGVKTSRIEGVPDECETGEVEDNQHLIEADHLLLSESTSLNSITSADTEQLESEYGRRKRLLLMRLVPLICCLVFLTAGVLFHEIFKYVTTHRHCILVQGTDFNLTFIHELLTNPDRHNLTRDELEMLNTTYHYESRNFGNQTFVYCPHHGKDYYQDGDSGYNETKLYRFLHPKILLHPAG